MLDLNLLRKDLAACHRGPRDPRLCVRSRGVRVARVDAQAVQTETEALQARRNALSKQVGQLKSRGEDASAVMAEVTAMPDTLKALEERLATVQKSLLGLLQGVPNLPHADDAGGPVRERQRRGPARRHAAHVRLRGEGPRRRRRRARPRLRDRGAHDGRTLLADEGPGRPAASGARAVHARPAHRTARLPRVPYAVPRQRPGADRHDAAAQVRGPAVLGQEGRGRGRRDVLPDPHVRGLADQHGVRRDRSGRPPADQAHGPYPVLPLGGRQLRTGHARHDPPASVRQGRDGADRRAVEVRCRARRDGRPCGDGAATARAAVPRAAPVHRRHRASSRR